jgi:hypothetical protein
MLNEHDINDLLAEKKEFLYNLKRQEQFTIPGVMNFEGKTEVFTFVKIDGMYCICNYQDSQDNTMREYINAGTVVYRV